MSARVVVSVPQTAKRGEIIEIRTLAGHEMETGFRRTQLGELIPRDIITRFVCLYNGVEVFSAELHPAVSANPLIAFSTVATESGTLEFRWSGDKDYAASQTAQITVV
jgi:sulfur-oxidizing protein SoxZ